MSWKYNSVGPFTFIADLTYVMFPGSMRFVSLYSFTLDTILFNDRDREYPFFSAPMADVLSITRSTRHPTVQVPTVVFPSVFLYHFMRFHVFYHMCVCGYVYVPSRF